MATIEEHKAAAGLAYPTPPIVWYLHRDDPMHVHDDTAVAYTVMTDVEGVTDRYEAAIFGVGDGFEWRTHLVRGHDIPRGGGSSKFATFELLRTEVAASFERRNEDARGRIAVKEFGREHVATLGIVFEPPAVAGPATATLAGIRPNSATLSHWTLSPSFHRDIEAYTFDAQHETFLPVVTLGFPGQVVFWRRGIETFFGIAPTIHLKDGANGLEVTVISADNRSLKRYFLRVTLV